MAPLIVANTSISIPHLLFEKGLMRNRQFFIWPNSWVVFQKIKCSWGRRPTPEKLVTQGLDVYRNLGGTKASRQGTKSAKRCKKDYESNSFISDFLWGEI